jgi:zinc transporter, ZIP family
VPVLTAAAWGLVGASSLLLGAALALARPWPRWAIGLVMAFGSGVLISSLAFDLVEDSLARGGSAPTAIGIAAGAVTYYVGDLLVSRRGARRARPGADADRAGGGAGPSGVGDEGGVAGIVVGAVLDGIPESAAIGISLLDGGDVGIVFVAAVFLSNVPEALSASAGLRSGGTPARRVLGLWAIVAAVSTAASAAGFGLLDGAGDGTIAGLSAYAGGAVLTMLASTMLPEAHREGGRVTGLVTTAGFLLAVVLDTLA